MWLVRTVISTGLGLALAGAVTGCGHGARAPATASPAVTPVVRLGPAFTPSRIHVAVGESFRVVPARGIRVDGDLAPGSCAGPAPPARTSPLLEKRCARGGVVLTARRPGSITLLASVRARCATGHMCPMWVTVPRLRVTIG